MKREIRIHPDLYFRGQQPRVGDLPPCKLCGAPSSPFDVVDFSKFCDADPYAFGFSGIPVYYHRCNNCECIFTEFFDGWKHSEFARFIYNDEYIKVDPDYAAKRPLDTAVEWSVRFDVLKGKSILDFGAGSGVFAQKMCQRGFNFDSYDPFSTPSMPNRTFDVVTAFEVIEHSPDPLETFKSILDMLGDKKIIIVGQSVQPDDIMSIRGGWWYIAPRNGHCTTYSEKSFRSLASALRLTYVPSSGLHGFFSDPEDELSARIIERLVD